MKTNKCESCQQNECCPCPDCKQNDIPRCEELEHKYGLRKWIFWFILIFVVVGLMGPFVAQCLLSVGVYKDQIDGLGMWNQYVGIVLGIVATILSLVSLVMGFHSTNEAYVQQRRAFDQYEATIEMLREVKNKVEDVKVIVGKKSDAEQIERVDPKKTTVNAADIE